MTTPANDMTRPQRAALLTLTDACTDSTEPIPCREEPTLWDGPQTRARQELVTRWELAAYTCLSRCPVLEKCKAYQATRPDVDGVLAGVMPRVPWARGEAS